MPNPSRSLLSGPPGISEVWACGRQKTMVKAADLRYNRKKV